MAGNSEVNVDYKKKIFDIAATAVFLAMILAALSQVVFRFILQISVPWTEELARIFYIYVTFFGTVLLEAENNQIKTTFLIDKLPPKARFGVQIGLNVFSMFFLVCLFIGAIFMFWSSMAMNFGTMPFLPVSVMYIPIIISCPFIIWYLFLQLLHFTAPKDIARELKEVLREDSGAANGGNK